MKWTVAASVIVVGIGFCSSGSARDVAAAREPEVPVGRPSVTTRAGELDLSVDNSVPEAWLKSMAVTLYPEQGGRVDGTADVLGFPSLNSGSWGKMEWKVSGSDVTGTLYKRDGTIEGTFEGRLSRTGLSGKFVHADGRVGMWSWKGPPPQ